MRVWVALSLLSACVCAIPAFAADSDTHSWNPGLSDRELAIQRWFSYLTFLQGHDTNPWTDWYDDKDQLGITAFRYQFAFCGYGCVAMAANTPAYRELLQQQLRDLCERMIDRRTWFWVPRYWDYGDGPPDPCKYENVMYTGHLTQLMSLYELMTGNMRFSQEGWDFVWKDGRKVHYTLEKAIQGLHEQSRKSPSGGICCEPGKVFVDCNSHSATSFVVFDRVHHTNYSDVNQRWFDWMRVNFPNQVPASPGFLYVVYDQKENFMIPVGDTGADCWALGYGYPWFPDTEFLKTGWACIEKNAGWVNATEDQCYAMVSEVLACCGGAPIGVANSFIPLAGVQAAGKDNPRVRGVLAWFEKTYGTPLDTDGDSHTESYCYQTCPKFRISATGNIAAALATEADSMRNLYRTSRDKILSAPTLAHVDYPNVFVRAAEYQAPILRFVLLKGKPSFSGETTVVCSQLPDNVVIRRDGAAWNSFKQEGPMLRITTDVDSEHVFEVQCPPAT